MKKAFLVLVAILGFANLADCLSKAPAQLDESKKPVDSGAITSPELEAFLGQKRLEASLQPEGCAEVEVDYGLAPAGMAKGYDWTSDYIKNGSFQATPRGKGKASKEVCWFEFNSHVSSAEAQKRIEADGEFLVADLWELNALGTAKPELQRSMWIVALGSGWRSPDGRVNVPVLLRNGTKRRLDLGWVDPAYWWSSGGRFLAVRK